MARISGVNVPTGKRVEIALTYIYGIGNTTASKIIEDAGIPKSRRVTTGITTKPCLVRPAVWLLKCLKPMLAKESQLISC